MNLMLVSCKEPRRVVKVLLQERGSTNFYKGSHYSNMPILSLTIFARYARVAYLECDLGQSEFTPGGMVALNIIEIPLLGPCRLTFPLRLLLNTFSRTAILSSKSPIESPLHRRHRTKVIAVTLPLLYTGLYRNVSTGYPNSHRRLSY